MSIGQRMAPRVCAALFALLFAMTAVPTPSAADHVECREGGGARHLDDDEYLEGLKRDWSVLDTLVLLSRQRLEELRARPEGQALDTLEVLDLTPLAERQRAIEESQEAAIKVYLDAARDASHEIDACNEAGRSSGEDAESPGEAAPAEESSDVTSESPTGDAPEAEGPAVEPPAADASGNDDPAAGSPAHGPNQWRRIDTRKNPLDGSTEYEFEHGFEDHKATCTPGPGEITMKWDNTDSRDNTILSTLRWTYTFEEPPDVITVGEDDELVLEFDGRVEGEYNEGLNAGATGGYSMGRGSLEASTALIDGNSIALSGATLRSGGDSWVVTEVTPWFPTANDGDIQVLWMSVLMPGKLDGCTVAYVYEYSGP